MKTEKDIIKVRVHDGIVGLLYIGSILLGKEFGLDWLYIAIGVAVLQLLKVIAIVTQLQQLKKLLKKQT